MSSSYSKQFSVKVKVPWWVAYHYKDLLHETFEQKLKGYLTKKFRVTTRAFKTAKTCKFTVIFETKPRNPEAIKSLVEKVSKDTVLKVTTDTLTKK